MVDVGSSSWAGRRLRKLFSQSFVSSTSTQSAFCLFPLGNRFLCQEYDRVQGCDVVCIGGVLLGLPDTWFEFEKLAAPSQCPGFRESSLPELVITFVHF